jgi:hypothetical protein
MKKLILISILVFSVSVKVQSQFQIAIGGTNHDFANSIIQTADSGFAVAGYTYSFAAGYEDMYIVKLNRIGSLQWTRTIGGTGDDVASSVIQTMDGGFALAGFTTSFGAGGADFYIVKLDASGTLQWSRTIGQAGNDYALSVIQTTDGGYAVAGLRATGGVFSSDMYVVRLDAAGSYLWSKTYGGSGDDVARTIIRTTDGGFAVAGYTNSFGAAGNDFFFVKLDTGGTLQWSRTVGGTGAGSDVVFSIIQTTDGGFALAGETQSFGAGSYDMYVVKLDAGGSLLWTRTAGGTSEDHGCSIVQTIDGGFAVAGYTLSFGLSDFYTVKLDNTGVLQWSRAFGGNGVESAYSIIKAIGGGFVLTGGTTSFGSGANDIYIVKIDSGGNSCGNTFSPSTISGTGGTLGTPTPTVTTQSPTVTSPVSTSGTGGTLTTICMVGIQPALKNIPVSFELSQNYPNPFNPTTKIKFDIPSNVKSEMSNVKLIIYDVLGREAAILVIEMLTPGTYEVTWDASAYHSGVYFYKLVVSGVEPSTTDQYSETRKMVLVK